MSEGEVSINHLLLSIPFGWSRRPHCLCTSLIFCRSFCDAAMVNLCEPNLYPKSLWVHLRVLKATGPIVHMPTCGPFWQYDSCDLDIIWFHLVSFDYLDIFWGRAGRRGLEGNGSGVSNENHWKLGCRSLAHSRYVIMIFVEQNLTWNVTDDVAQVAIFFFDSISREFSSITHRLYSIYISHGTFRQAPWKPTNLRFCTFLSQS